MNALAFIVALTSGYFVWIAGYVVRAQSHTLAGRLFAAVNLLFAWMSVCLAFTISAPTIETAELWNGLSPISWSIAPALVLHFLLVLSERKRFTRRPFLVLIYTPAIVLLWYATTRAQLTNGFVQSPLGWVEKVSRDLWSHLFVLYYLSYIVIGLTSMWLWGGRSSSLSRRRQVQHIIFGGIVTTALIVLTDRLLPLLGVLIIPSVAPLWLAIWVTGIWRSMTHYNLMMMSPSVAAEEILATMSEAVLLAGPDNRVITVNKAASRLLKLEAPQLIRANIKELFPNNQISTTQLIRHTDLQNLDFEREFTFRRGDDTTVDLLVTTSTVHDSFKQVVGIVMILRDITLQKQAQRRLNHLAHHDPLTNLPNRLLLLDRLERTVIHIKRYGRAGAVMLLDLDRFKEVNDTLGHDHGDILLKQVAERLLRCVRTSDTVARMGGDEFVLVLDELVEKQDANIVAGRVLAAFEKDFQVKQHALHISPSIGIALCPAHAGDADELLRLADIAMYESKRSGRATSTMFREELLADVQIKSSLEADLRHAMEKQQLMLHYQPLFDLTSNTIIGVEALLRWNHPEKGLISPMDFIPMAESAGLMVPIGKWVLHTACTDLSRWNRTRHLDLWVAVNLTARQFAAPDLAASVSHILKDTGIAPANLQVELNESVLFQRANRNEILAQLKEIGVRVALDNFGVSYSSLIEMEKLPIDSLKIDRSLIQRLADDRACAVVVASAIAVAHQYGLTVVAEGVEQDAQLQALKALSSAELGPLVCDEVQGFLFGRPATPAQLDELLRQQADNTSKTTSVQQA